MTRIFTRRLQTKAARQLLARLAFALLLGLGFASTALAAGQPSASPAGAEPPAKVGQLLDLLSDPEVQGWIKTHQDKSPAPATEAPGDEATPSGFLGQRMAAIRQHLVALVAVVPVLPGEFSQAGASLMQELGGRPILALALLLGFLALGFGAEWLFGRIFRNLREWLHRRPADTAVQHLASASAHFAFELASLAAFGLGSIGLFLIMQWPPLLEHIVLGYLVAFIALRLYLILGRFLLAPQQDGAGGTTRHPILPLTAATARFWHKRLAWLVGWFFFGWVTVGLLGRLGFDIESRHFVAYVLGLGLVAIGLEAVWRQPAQSGSDDERSAHGLGSWLFSGYIVLLFLLWVASMLQSFWLCVVLVAVPALLRLTRGVASHWLRASAGEESRSPVPSVLAVCLQRGLQDAIIIGGALFLAHAWHLDLAELTLGDSVSTRLLRGAFSVIVIGLLADFAWQLVKTAIDRKIAEPPRSTNENSAEWRRQARLKTVLPVLRNLFFITLLVMVAMLALATMGVDIAPLIAGAGVVGVAIGFGSQTLVKDIISGMFYLLDDAFRVGEYIQSGNYKGTVESFSLRSVKLRHHRGPLFTIPFGVLGAVQNMSRDWVIDKLQIGVSYDTDLGKVKKLIKQIGAELKNDPELGPKILETLKMQGVQEFGDFAIEIVMKMMTKPGEQFAVRRRAYSMIKKAFDENGIEMPLPTVTVATGESPAAAAAQHELTALRQQKEAV